MDRVLPKYYGVVEYSGGGFQLAIYHNKMCRGTAKKQKVEEIS